MEWSSKALRWRLEARLPSEKKGTWGAFWPQAAAEHSRALGVAATGLKRSTCECQNLISPRTVKFGGKAVVPGAAVAVPLPKTAVLPRPCLTFRFVVSRPHLAAPLHSSPSPLHCSALHASPFVSFLCLPTLLHSPPSLVLPRNRRGSNQSGPGGQDLIAGWMGRAVPCCSCSHPWRKGSPREAWKFRREEKQALNLKRMRWLTTVSRESFSLVGAGELDLRSQRHVTKKACTCDCLPPHLTRRRGNVLTLGTLSQDSRLFLGVSEPRRVGGISSKRLRRTLPNLRWLPMSSARRREAAVRQLRRSTWSQSRESFPPRWSYSETGGGNTS